MKNKTKKIIAFSIAAISIFTVGGVVGATQTDLWTSISQDAASQIDTAAKAKTDSLTTDVQSEVEQKVKDKISPEIDARKQKIQDDLDAYFSQKISTVTDSQQYKDAVKDLDRIESVLEDNYKAEIDKALGNTSTE